MKKNVNVSLLQYDKAILLGGGYHEEVENRGGLYLTYERRSALHLVLQGHDRVVLRGVDVQNVVLVLAAQVVGDVGEGGAGRLRHAVVDDDYVIALAQRRLVPAILSVALFNLPHFMPCDGALCEVRGETKGGGVSGSAERKRLMVPCSCFARSHESSHLDGLFQGCTKDLSP